MRSFHEVVKISPKDHTVTEAYLSLQPDGISNFDGTLIEEVDSGSIKSTSIGCRFDRAPTFGCSFIRKQLNRCAINLLAYPNSGIGFQAVLGYFSYLK